MVARQIFLSPLGLSGMSALLLAQIFGWVFLPLIDVRGLWEWRGPIERTTGTVVEIASTSASVNRRRVMAVTFEHSGRTGTSYGEAATEALEPGAIVAVEMPAGRPQGARIVGMRRTKFPEWTLAPVGIPLVGPLFVMALAVGVGWRRVGILRRSESVIGKVLSSERTNVRINRQRVHRLRVAIPGGEVTVRSHHPRHLVAGAELALFVEAGRGRALLGETLPGKPRLVHGDIVNTDGLPATLGIVLAVAAVGGWVAIVLVHFA